MAWRGYAASKVDLRARLRDTLLAMGGMRLARTFYWWLALARWVQGEHGTCGGTGVPELWDPRPNCSVERLWAHHQSASDHTKPCQST